MADGRRCCRILGLDPGSRFTGFGVVERKGSQWKPVAHGRWTLPAKAPLVERLALLSAQAESLIERHRPDSVALESLFHGINPRSLIVLAQARGALVAVIGRAGIELYEYTPAEIKSAVTGSGRADKEQVSRMVRLILGLGEEGLSADAGDALAVALCLAQRSRLDRLVSGAQKWR
ncbi:MAG: crossover junction endodeoxyribonuclease RuvC [Acidobacteriota bacterium]